MMIEFGDHGEEEQRLLLCYLETAKPEPVNPPKMNWFWRLMGRLYLAYLFWRYGNRRP